MIFFFSGKPSLKTRYSNTYQFESIKSNHNLFFDKAVVDIDVSEDALSKNIISITSNFLFESKTASDLFYDEVHELFNARTIKVTDSYEINDDIKESVFTNKKFNTNTTNNIYLVYNQKSKDGFFEIFVQIGK